MEGAWLVRAQEIHGFGAILSCCDCKKLKDEEKIVSNN
jgi:hypothetical protein